MACRFEEPTWEQTQQNYRAKLDELTQYICGTLTELKDMEQKLRGASYPYRQVLNKVEGLDKWWEHHQALDEAEKVAADFFQQQQKLKDSAMSKLTVEEAKALGIKI